MIELCLWAGFLGFAIWAGFRMVSLGRKVERGEAARDDLEAVDDANRVREEIRADDRDPRERLRDDWLR